MYKNHYRESYLPSCGSLSFDQISSISSSILPSRCANDSSLSYTRNNNDNEVKRYTPKSHLIRRTYWKKLKRRQTFDISTERTEINKATLAYSARDLEAVNNRRPLGSRKSQYARSFVVGQLLSSRLILIFHLFRNGDFCC